MSLTKNPVLYVIPHHVVTKESTSTTVERVVLNASVPVCFLLDRLFIGPKLKNRISNILMYFRYHNTALCADAQKMYRPVLVRPADLYAQNIFWRPSPDENV